MTQINEENLRACTAAMRSGEFPQSQHRLRNENEPRSEIPAGWCCLGIVCEVFHRATGRGEWVLSDNGSFWKFMLDGGQFVNYLPPQVRDWVGLPEYNPEIGEYESTHGPVTFAAAWNDSGIPLDKIADAFEATFLGVA
jgi:hypothetical protein